MRRNGSALSMENLNFDDDDEGGLDSEIEEEDSPKAKLEKR